jgi:N4-gp56 family major capsid protein
MPVTIQGASNQTALNAIYYEEKSLDRLVRMLRFKQLAKMSTGIPKKSGDTVYWIRTGELHVTDPDDYATVETVVGAEQALVFTTVSKTVKEYSNYAIVGDITAFAGRTATMDEVVSALSDQAAELYDTICRNELQNNLPAQYANSLGSVGAITAGDILTVKEGLKAHIALAKDAVGPHESGAYVCVIHPASKGDVMNDTNAGAWVDVKKYVDPDPLLRGELGECYGVRYLTSQNIYSANDGSGSATVYRNIFMGEGCFGMARLGKDSYELNMKTSDENTTSDPNNQINTVGFKYLGLGAKYLGGSSNGTKDRGRVIYCGSQF